MLRTAAEPLNIFPHFLLAYTQTGIIFQRQRSSGRIATDLRQYPLHIQRAFLQAAVTVIAAIVVVEVIALDFVRQRGDQLCHIPAGAVGVSHIDHGGAVRERAHQVHMRLLRQQIARAGGVGLRILNGQQHAVLRRQPTHAVQRAQGGSQFLLPLPGGEVVVIEVIHHIPRPQVGGQGQRLVPIFQKEGKLRLAGRKTGVDIPVRSVEGNGPPLQPRQRALLQRLIARQLPLGKDLHPQGCVLLQQRPYLRKTGLVIQLGTHRNGHTHTFSPRFF